MVHGEESVLIDSSWTFLWNCLVSVFSKTSKSIMVTTSFFWPEILKEKRTFAEVIATSIYNEQLRFKRDKLTIKSVLFMDMFKEPIQNIIHEISTIFQHERCSYVSAIMMIGRFSEADVSQKVFSDIEVFIPVDGSLCFKRSDYIWW